MATALVKISASPRQFRKLVNGRWMVTSFETAPVVPASLAPAFAAPRDERRRGGRLPGPDL